MSTSEVVVAVLVISMVLLIVVDIKVLLIVVDFTVVAVDAVVLAVLTAVDDSAVLTWCGN